MRIFGADYSTTHLYIDLAGETFPEEAELLGQRLSGVKAVPKNRCQLTHPRHARGGLWLGSAWAGTRLFHAVEVGRDQVSCAQVARSFSRKFGAAVRGRSHDADDRQVHGGQGDLTIAEEFDQVNQQLAQNEAGLFTRVDSGARVAIYRASVAYIEERGDDEGPFVAV